MARLKLKEDLRPLSDLETFEDLQSSSDHLELQRGVEDAERDIAEGNWIEGSDVLAKLTGGSF